MISRTTGFLFAALGALLMAPGIARAAVLEVAPVTIELSGGAQTAAITLVSRDPGQVYVQVRGFVWSQSGNTDTLTPSTDIALAPPIFSLPTGTPQVVRIVLQQPASEQERAYRLLIDEIPAHTGKTGVQFALRLSLPVFVEPDQIVATRLRAHLETQPGGTTVLVVANVGTRRTRLVDLGATDASGATVKLSAPPNPYILPGATRSWTLIHPGTAIHPGASLHVTAKTDLGPYTAQVAFTS